MDGLRRLVVGWNINPRLFDLAFLVSAIEHCHPKGALEFFLGGRFFTTIPGFRQAVAGVCGVSTQKIRYTFKKSGLVTRFGDGEDRVLWWNRDVLILPPLFELMTHIAPDSMQQDCEALGDAGIGADDVKTVAGGWQKRMYDWLKELIGARDENAYPLAPLTQDRTRHFNRMVRWMRDNANVDGAGDEDSPVSKLLDDERVLAFWRDHWPEHPGEAPDATLDGHAHAAAKSIAKSKGYRTFRLVAELAMHLWNAEVVGSAKKGSRVSIVVHDQDHDDDDKSISEYSLEHSDGGHGADPTSLLQAFESPPLAKIKFFKKKEQERDAANSVVGAGTAAHRLPLTLLRDAVFGAHQRRLSQALGKRRSLDALLACEGLPTYHTWVEHLRHLVERLSTLRRCCLHVLVNLRDPYAVGRLHDEWPDLACWDDIRASVVSDTASHAEYVNRRVGEAFTDAFFCGLQSTRNREPLLNEYLKRCRHAFDSTKGFKSLPDADMRLDGMHIAGVYALGDERLRDLTEVIEGFLRTLKNRSGSEGLKLEEEFASDLDLFREGFTRIYARGAPA